MTRPAGAVTYRAVLRLPGAPRAFTAAVIGRLSYGILPLSLLVTVQSASGSYAPAGAAIGVFGLVSILMPAKSRLIGRFGQRTMLPALSAGFTAAMVTMAACAAAGLRSSAVYIALAAVLGLAAPPLGPSMRSIWASLTPGLALRQRAYGLDTTVESALFAIGPIIAGALLALWGGAGALTAVAALNLVGSVGLATAPAGHQVRRADGPMRSELTGPFASPGFGLLVLVMVGIGLGAGPVDVAVVARAEAVGREPAAGWLLGALAVGGGLGGLAWARAHHRRPVSVQLGGLIGVSAAAMLAVTGAPTVWLLALALALFGLVDSPSFIVAYLAADDLVPAQHRTEATTWVITASNVGLSIGAAGAGAVIDRLGPGAALQAGAAVLLLTAGFALWTGDRLAGHPPVGGGS